MPNLYGFIELYGEAVLQRHRLQNAAFEYLSAQGFLAVEFPIVDRLDKFQQGIQLASLANHYGDYSLGDMGNVFTFMDHESSAVACIPPESTPQAVAFFQDYISANLVTPIKTHNPDGPSAGILPLKIFYISKTAQSGVTDTDGNREHLTIGAEVAGIDAPFSREQAIENLLEYAINTALLGAENAMQRCGITITLSIPFLERFLLSNPTPEAIQNFYMLDFDECLRLCPEGANSETARIMDILRTCTLEQNLKTLYSLAELLAKLGQKPELQGFIHSILGIGEQISQKFGNLVQCKFSMADCSHHLVKYQELYFACYLRSSDIGDPMFLGGIYGVDTKAGPIKCAGFTAYANALLAATKNA